ncbi:MAG: HypC/HybG/HupF family hydrogenase formation chaperone [Actinobacteria bacterium]|nr:HypC/HybG/HupF family hydrogenase formation chaperone [Actinomycetota bacterium]
MCLAIPAQIIELSEGSLGTVEILGVTREVSFDLTPHVQLGDYVLVHAGFAIEVVSEEFAQETLDLIRQFPDLIADDVSGLEDKE